MGAFDFSRETTPATGTKPRTGSVPDSTAGTTAKVTVRRKPGLNYESLPDYAAPILEAAREDLTKAARRKSRLVVFLLCNFVYQRRPGESLQQFFAKTTHVSVVRAMIRSLLDAFGDGITVRVGNAPLKGATWDRLDADVGLSALAAEFNTPGRAPLVEIHDLRMNVQERTNVLGWTRERRNDDRSDDIVAFDLGADSLLDEHAPESARYRVHTYPTSRIQNCHGPGRHVYLLNHKFLEADMVISIPKLKTHEKVGLTAAIKGCVGSVAHKDCLAHHRKGGEREGGDEYPGGGLVPKALSAYHEFAYDRAPSMTAQLLRVGERIAGKLHRSSGGLVAGAWPGNDTCWRMAVDLARLVAHGTCDGEISDDIIRPHFALTDGIIAGEGQGPLKPDPVAMGFLGWSGDPVAADYVNALTAGIDPSALPIVSRSFGPMRYPVTKLDGPGSITIEDEDGPTDLSGYAAGNRPLRMPRGW